MTDIRLPATEFELLDDIAYFFKSVYIFVRFALTVRDNLEMTNRII